MLTDLQTMKEYDPKIMLDAIAMSIVELIKQLPYDLRKQIFYCFCVHCGRDDYYCKCSVENQNA